MLVLPEANLCYYEEIKQPKDSLIRSAHIFKLQQKSYILLRSYCSMDYCIYDVEANKNFKCDLNYEEDFKGVFVNQNYLYVLSQEHIFQIYLIGQEFKIKKKFVIYKENYDSIMRLIFINKYQNMVLEEKNKIIKLKSFKLQKQIFRIDETAQSNISYDLNNGFIIQQGKPKDQQKCVSIMNLRNRQIIFRWLIFRKSQIQYIQNTDYILLQMYDRGLSLYKINYNEKAIENQKVISLNVESICLFDDNNLLNIVTPNLFVKYDKFYNVIQRFNINYGQINIGLLTSLNQVKIRNNFPELFSFESITNLPIYRIYKQKLMQKQENNDVQFCECKTYQIEYQYNAGRQQHLISPDQYHLTFIIGHSLMFHGIESQVDIYLHFNDLIRYLAFSNNSNSLYVTLYNRIFCYKTKQNLKIRNIYHQKMDQLQINQMGLIIAIKSSGSVIAINKQTQKMIFKLNTIENYQSFDYESSNGTILVASEKKVSQINLVNRKLIVNSSIENKPCKFIQNTNHLFVITTKKQLQLWSFTNKFLLVQKQLIIGQVEIILECFSEFYCLRMIDKIILVNKQYQIVEQIEYKSVKRDIDVDFNIDLISQDDQIIQKNYILRMSICPQTDIFGDEERCENVILKLEPRQNKM